MKDIYIIGAGGFGREIVWLIERINNKKPTWNICGFIDDNELLFGKSEGGYKILGGCDFLNSLKDCYAVCAIGNAIVRKRIVESLEESSIKFATLIDPSVILSKQVKIGDGSIICAGNILTVDVTIGSHVIINLDCTVGHDAVIDDFVTIYPSANISGQVVVNKCTEIGTGVHIIQGKQIASNTIIGAGAVVVRDCYECGTYVGNPAKKIK